VTIFLSGLKKSRKNKVWIKSWLGWNQQVTFNLAHILKENEIKFVAVNPLHVKKSKELDDNSPTKNDVKDAKVIAQLVKDGRYAEPTIPQGVYAELRVAKKIRDLLTEDLQTVQGQVHNWIDRYFPEFLTVFKKWEGKAALQFLKLYGVDWIKVSMSIDTSYPFSFSVVQH
jgi:transposase